MMQAVAAFTGGREIAPSRIFTQISARALTTKRAVPLRPLFNRRAIEAQIEALIDMLDRIDGDCDFEPDHEFYDACELFEVGDYTSEPLEYGSDQSAGPINVKGFVPSTGPDFARFFDPVA